MIAMKRKLRPNQALVNPFEVFVSESCQQAGREYARNASILSISRGSRHAFADILEVLASSLNGAAAGDSDSTDTENGEENGDKGVPRVACGFGLHKKTP